MKDKKLWIGRTYKSFDDPEDQKEIESYIERHPKRWYFGTRLLAFYDKPTTIDVERLDARLMCEIPNYMFQEIEPGQCVEFSFNKYIKY